MLKVNSKILITFIISIIWLLTSCAYHLRGQQNATFSTLAVTSKIDNALLTKFTYLLENTTNIKVVPKEQAEVYFEILDNSSNSYISSTSSTGLVQEHYLTRNITFKLTSSDGTILIANMPLRLNYALNFTEEQSLAKQQEQQQLFEQMEENLIRKIIYQITSIKSF